MHCISNTNKITLDPAELKVQQIPLLQKSTLEMLKQHNIQLTIDTYDSDVNSNSKPIILFIHGNSSSKNIFKKQYQYYKSKFRIISFDMLGHGKSTKLNTEYQLSSDNLSTLARYLYSLEGMTAVAIQLLQMKKVQNANVIGWSLGGHVALSIASSHPELINNIVTIGTPPIDFNTNGIKLGFNKWFINTIIPHWITNPQPLSTLNAIEISEHIGITEQDDLLLEDLITSDPLMRKYLFNNIDEITDFNSIINAEAFVQKTNIPLCFIVGECDAGVNVQYINSFAGSLQHPASQIAIVDNAPHATFVTHEKDCHKIIDDFYNRILYSR